MSTMKKLILVLVLLPCIVYGKPIIGLNDYGELLSPKKFSVHCKIEDPGISGYAVIDVYSNGQIECKTLQKNYFLTYVHMHDFLIFNKYDFTPSVSPKILTLRIVTLAELNNPNNFSQTDKRCMYNIRCESGAFFGRTFYSITSSNINIYVVYHEENIHWRYSFASSMDHELMHAILYRYQWSHFLSGDAEHN